MDITTNGKIDPRRCGVALDTMVLDKNGSPRDALVDRLLALRAENSINFVEPGTVYSQTQHPNTPAAVRQAIGAQIFTLPAGLNQDEQQRKGNVLAIMRGNATTDKHDADAAIIFEAGKHGGYLVTEDARILARRAELVAAMGPPLCILSLAEFLLIYDLFVEEEREREKLMATVRGR